MSTNNSNLLRNTLYANSTFCTVSGLSFAIFLNPISNFLGLANSWVILILGVALVLYGIEVFVFARKEQISEGFAKFVIGADVAWVIASVVLIFTSIVPFTTAGKWAIAIVADIVLVFAIVQYVGLKRMKAS